LNEKQGVIAEFYDNGRIGIKLKSTGLFLFLFYQTYLHQLKRTGFVW
jgi:hypothetical protein